VINNSFGDQTCLQQASGAPLTLRPSAHALRARHHLPAVGCNMLGPKEIKAGRRKMNLIKIKIEFKNK
jgi:hypothetical protein